MSVSLNPEVAQHYAAGKALSAALERDAAKAWELLDPEVEDPAKIRAVLAALVQEYGLAAVAINSDYYTSLRESAGVRGAPFPIVSPASAGYVEATLLWSMSPEAGTAEGMATRTIGLTQKMVANAGRRQVFAGMEADRVRRWARVTSAGSCYFCRMLATRGAVYRTADTADFDAHGNCNCAIEPVFAAVYEPTAQTRADQRLWADSTAGLSGQDAINAFRRAIYAQTGA